MPTPIPFSQWKSQQGSAGAAPSTGAIPFSQYKAQQNALNTDTDLPSNNTAPANPKPFAQGANGFTNLKPSGLVSKIGNFFTSGLQKYGNTEGNLLATGKDSKAYTDYKNSFDTVKTNLVKTIAQQKAAGKDTTRLETALKNHNASQLSMNDFTGNTYEKTGGQVVGESINAGLDIAGLVLGGGAAAEGAEEVAKKGAQAAVKKGAIAGAQAGAVFGGGSGAATALETKQSPTDVAKKTAEGAGVGAIAGGALGAGLGKLAQVITPKTQGQIEENSINKITDTISPKDTVNEAKLATKEGRFVKGKAPTFFKGETPDTILPSDQTKKSAATILKLIPGAEKMDEPTMYSATDKKVTQIAKDLEPKMQAVPIGQETVTKTNSAWKNLAAKEIEEADASEEANIKKSQAQFTARLQKINSGKVSDIIDRARSGELNQSEFEKEMTARIKKIQSSSLDDIWKAAKDYDNSIPENVKKANSLSSESLQNKKSIWLNRRALFKTAINDSKNGLGNTSKGAFSDMTNLYEAQNGILSKAKVNTDLKPSKLGNLIKHPVAKGIGAAVGTGGIYEGAKKWFTGTF